MLGDGLLDRLHFALGVVGRAEKFFGLARQCVAGVSDAVIRGFAGVIQFLGLIAEAFGESTQPLGDAVRGFGKVSDLLSEGAADQLQAFRGLPRRRRQRVGFGFQGVAVVVDLHAGADRCAGQLLGLLFEFLVEVVDQFQCVAHRRLHFVRFGREDAAGGRNAGVHRFGGGKQGGDLCRQDRFHFAGAVLRFVA